MNEGVKKKVNTIKVFSLFYNQQKKSSEFFFQLYLFINIKTKIHFIKISTSQNLKLLSKRMYLYVATYEFCYESYMI